MFSIGLIGFGHIGATLAHVIMQRKPHWSMYAYDINTRPTMGKILDITHANAIAHKNYIQGDPCAKPLAHHDHIITCEEATTDYPVRFVEHLEDMAACHVVVVTAGATRQPFSTREELLHANAAVVRHVASALRGSQAMCIMVTNPLDVMTWLFCEVSGFPPQRVMGMAGILDSGRCRVALARALHVPLAHVDAVVVGAHNHHMLPVRMWARYQGAPLSSQDLSPDIWQTIVQETRDGGKAIGDLLGEGTAFYAPAEGVYAMLCALDGQSANIPASVCLSHTSQDRIFTGALARIGPEGIEHVYTAPLRPEEEPIWHQGLEHLQQARAMLCVDDMPQ